MTRSIVQFSFSPSSLLKLSSAIYYYYTRRTDPAMYPYREIIRDFAKSGR